MKKTILLIAMFAGNAMAETPMFPTTAVYSPMQAWDKTAAWSLPKRPRGYIATISTMMRFGPAISDYVTCTIPGMTGAAGTETVRFSVSFSETKTVTMTGFVSGATLGLSCISEGLKQYPISIDAQMSAVSVDAVTKR